MKKFVLMGLAALAFSGAWAITATKEYVDRSTNAVLVASKAETAAATNATLAASKAYTDAAIEQAGSVMPGAVTNISGVVTSNVVTKAYVEGLGIEAGINETTATNIAGTVTSNVVTKAYVEGLGIEAGINETTATNIAGTVTSNVVSKTYVEGLLIGLISDGLNEIHADLKANVVDGFTYVPSVDDTASPDIFSNIKWDGTKYVCDHHSYGEYIGIDYMYLNEFQTIPATNKNASVIYFPIPSRAFAERKPVTRTTRIATTNDIPTTAEQIGAATPEYVDEQNQATRAIVESWEGFLDGSNVVFSITNYISGAYNLNSAKLKILEMANGVYREVYNSRDEIVMHIDNFRTNDFRIATNDVITSVDSKIADKADRAWGKYTSAGGVAPSNTVYMTAPSTVFAGGLEYKRVAVGEGAVGILTTHGAPVYTTGDEGTFKFQDDGGTNYFGFAKTDSYVIGCNTDGISVQNNIVTLTYNVTMSGVPCIWYCPSLDVHPIVWEQLNTPDGQPIAGASHTVTWEASPAAGTEVCYLNCPEAKGFFKATIEVDGSAKFMTNMPADLLGGIICTNTATGVNGIIRPSFNGSSVIWTWSGL